jgi:hypothetical protein
VLVRVRLQVAAGPPVFRGSQRFVASKLEHGAIRLIRRHNTAPCPRNALSDQDGALLDAERHHKPFVCEAGYGCAAKHLALGSDLLYSQLSPAPVCSPKRLMRPGARTTNEGTPPPKCFAKSALPWPICSWRCMCLVHTFTNTSFRPDRPTTEQRI